MPKADFSKWVTPEDLARFLRLSPEDLDSILQLEAEKGFPYDSAQLQISRSIHRSAEAAYVTQLAVRKDRLEHLAAVVKAARLKPVSFSLGLAAGCGLDRSVAVALWTLAWALSYARQAATIAPPEAAAVAGVIAAEMLLHASLRFIDLDLLAEPW